MTRFEKILVSYSEIDNKDNNNLVEEAKLLLSSNEQEERRVLKNRS